MNISNDILRPMELISEQVSIPLWKRLLDIVLILTAFPLLFPLMAVIALVIRCVSTGPVLFVQERIGFQGRRFRCLKFRTMKVNADTSLHQSYLKSLMQADVPMEKMDSRGDGRIIPFGLLLRSSGLDELPQIFNVLCGEMSLVGPRPCLPYEYDQYLPWQKERCNTLPGLTGLWQVSGKNRTTFVEMIRMDITYANQKTLWLDIKIISATVPAVLIQMLEVKKSRKKRSTVGQASANISR